MNQPRASAAAAGAAAIVLMGSAILAGMTAEQKTELNRQTRIQLARICAKDGDILNWGKALFPDKFSLPFCHELHDYFVEIRRHPFTNTEAPRGHAKTAVSCFLIPLYQALNEPTAYRHYLNVQATDEKALAVNRAIKVELEMNQELRQIYGDQIGERWTDQQFVLANGVCFTSKSAGQSIRGINYRNRRPDYIVVDDLYNEEDLNNPDSTLKKNAWFWGALYNARSKTKESSVHVRGTAINNEDLLEQLKGVAGVTSRTFKAIEDLGGAGQRVLWSELNTLASLEADKDKMGSVIWFREMQNERRDDSTSLVKQAWLDGWEFDPATLRLDGTEKLIAVKLGVDPSIGESHESDATGVALVWKTKATEGTGNRFYIMGLWNERISLNERILLLDRIRLAQPSGRQITQAPIEAIAGFKDFCAEVKRRTNLPVREIAMVKDKISVLESRSHYFENHKVKISKNISKSLRDMLLYQLTTNHPKHDDLRDAVLLTLEEDTGWGWVG